jgi:hypothetical protein
MAMFKQGKALKAHLYDPAGSWTNGVDLAAALRRVVEGGTDVLLPSTPDDDGEDVAGVPELRWLGNGPTCSRWYLPGRRDWGDDPRRGAIVEAGSWNVVGRVTWKRVPPPRSVVREIALHRVPVVRRDAGVDEARERRERVEEALFDELTRASIPVASFAWVALSTTGRLVLAGPGGDRDQALAELRGRLSAVVGVQPAEVRFVPRLSALPEVVGGDLLARISKACVECQVLYYVPEGAREGGLDPMHCSRAWALSMGGTLRLGGADGSLSATGGLADRVGARLEELHGSGGLLEAAGPVGRLAIVVRELTGSELEYTIVLAGDGTIAQAMSHCAPADEGGATDRAAELAGEALIDLSDLEHVYDIVDGLRRTLVRQLDLAAADHGWLLAPLDEYAVEHVRYVSGVDEGSNRLRLPPVPPREGVVDRVALTRTEAAVTFAEAVAGLQEGGSTRVTMEFVTPAAPPAAPPAPRAARPMGMCRTCERSMELGEDWRLPPHDWRRARCAGSGSQVRPVGGDSAAAPAVPPTPPSKKKAKVEDTGGRVFVAPPSPAPDAGDDLPWGAP